jgi:hypothetical protein
MAALPDRVRALVPDAYSVAAEVAVAIHVAAGRVRQLGVSIGRNYQIEPGEIAGTLDLLAVTPSTVLALDWKGHRRLGAPDRHEQLLFAGLAASRMFPGRRVILAIGYPDDWIDHVEVDELELDAFAARLTGLHAAVAAQSSRAAPDVAEGPHCEHCPAMHACPAKVALMRRLTSGAEADELEMMMPLDDRTARLAYERLQAARHLLRRVESAVYARAAESPIPLGEGRFLGKHTKRGNEKIDGNIAYEAIRDMRGQSAADMAVERRATKKAIGEALKWALAPGETLKAAEAATLAEIRARGGASRDEREVVEEYTLTLGEGDT